MNTTTITIGIFIFLILYFLYKSKNKLNKELDIFERTKILVNVGIGCLLLYTNKKYTNAQIYTIMSFINRNLDTRSDEEKRGTDGSLFGAVDEDKYSKQSELETEKIKYYINFYDSGPKSVYIYLKEFKELTDRQLKTMILQLVGEIILDTDLKDPEEEFLRVANMLGITEGEQQFEEALASANYWHKVRKHSVFNTTDHQEFINRTVKNRLSEEL